MLDQSIFKIDFDNLLAISCLQIGGHFTKPPLSHDLIDPFIPTSPMLKPSHGCIPLSECQNLMQGRNRLVIDPAFVKIRMTITLVNLQFEIQSNGNYDCLSHDFLMHF